MKLQVRVNIGGVAAVRAAMAGGTLRGPEFDAWRVQLGARYSTFSRRRFDTFSRGGGDWEPLAVSTIKARRPPDKRAQRAAIRAGRSTSTLARDTSRGGVLTQVAGRVASILADTGILRRALTIGSSGNVNESTPLGIAFGFAAVMHPPKDGKALGPTIGEIATYHQTGGKHLPQRKILVPPDAATAAAMAGDLKRAVLAIAKRGAR